MLALVAGVLLLPAPPADAHTRTQETTNVVSRVTADPGLPGVAWTIHTGGLLVEVINSSGEVLVVEGYEGEPYLRIGPDGVDRNRRSPATYLNDGRVAQRVSSRTGVAMPAAADASAPPEWVHLHDEPRAIWRDARVRWTATEPPAFVKAGPVSRAMMRVNLVGVIGHGGGTGAFQEWVLPVTFGGEPDVLEGELVWEDPPSAVPYLVVAALLVAPGLWGLRRRDPAAVLRPATFVVLVVAAVNGIHLVDDLIAWPSAVLDELFGVLHTSLFLGAGIGAAVWSLRTGYGRVLSLVIASAAVLYHQGFVHLPMLNASHFPTVWPDPLLRITIAAGLLQAVVVAAVVVRARRVADRDAAALHGPPDGAEAVGTRRVG